VANDTDFRNVLRRSPRQLREQLAKWIRTGNRRQLVLRNAEGATLLRLPLMLAVVVGLLLLWQAAPLLLVAFIVALALRVQFLIAGELERTTTIPEAK
jgi:hypothetical protein